MRLLELPVAVVDTDKKAELCVLHARLVSNGLSKVRHGLLFEASPSNRFLGPTAEA